MTPRIPHATLARALAVVEAWTARRKAQAQQQQRRISPQAAPCSPAPPPRTFTLKDTPDPIRAEARQRARARNPFPDGDLAAAGLRFVGLPDANARGPLQPGERELRREEHRDPERRALAGDWLARIDAAGMGGDR